jgi:hypothetical protein
MDDRQKNKRGERGRSWWGAGAGLFPCSRAEASGGVLCAVAMVCLMQLASAVGAAAARPGADSATVYVAQAREAASADRHREAIRLYLRACAVDSSLSSELGGEIGFQYTWNDEAGRALPWFRRYLALHAEDDAAAIGYARALSWTDSLDAARRVYRLVGTRSPGNLDAMLGEAQVAAWMGENGDAESLYRAVLDHDPGNWDAQLGLAQVMNWQGRHREARDLYGGILRDRGDDSRALVGLASAEHWLGRDDRARRILIGRTADEDARKLLAEIDRAESPSARVDYGISHDSDELVIHRVEAGATVFPGDLTSVAVSGSRFSMRQNSRPRIVSYSLTVGLHRRLSDDWAVHFNAVPTWSSYDMEAPDTVIGISAGEHSFNPFTWNGWLTWTPHRRLRIDISGNRMTVDTPLSYMREITFDAVGAGADVTAAERATVRGGYEFRGYSDGNNRHAWNSDVSFLVLRKPLEVSVAPGCSGFSFSKYESNGYYNPLRYDNVGLTFEAVGSRGAARLAVNGRVSAERESGGDFFAVGAVDASLEVGIGGRTTAGAEFFTSNSRIAGAAGYSRTLGAVFVSVRF